MAHHQYTTEACVLGRLPHKEASMTLILFTRELGLLYAHAQNVRDVSSKLRPSLQEYSLAHITLVRGKTGWRVTNAASIENLYFELKHDPAKMRVCAHAVKLIATLVVGEEKNERLFDIFISGVKALAHVAQDLKVHEVLLMVRLVHELGYVSQTPELRPWLSNTEWGGEIETSCKPNILEAVAAVNKGIKESQL